MFERTLRVIITDPVFWLAAALVAALAGCIHYLMKHYYLCTSSWGRVGRYVSGILCIAVGFAGWYAKYPDAAGPRIVGVVVLLTLAAGLATCAAYAVDNTVDRERRGQDLRERGTPVEG